MPNQYVSLAGDFTLKHSTSMSTLYCLRNGTTYELTADQVEFLQSLDGTNTVEQILKQYAKTSRVDVLQFIDQLKNISAVEFTNASAPRVLGRNQVPDRRLEAVHLEASGKCDMKCVHCYQAEYVKSGEELSFDEIIRLLDDLQGMQVNNIGISGGEPLMMSRLADVLSAIEERKMRISAIFSNGLLINGRFIQAVQELRSQFSLFVSLDSIPGVDFSFRGFSSKDSRKVLERIVRNIMLLTSKGISVVVNTVVNMENIDHLDAMYDLVKRMSVSSWRLGFPKMTPEFKNYRATFNVEWGIIAERCLVLLRRHLANGMPFHLQIEYLFREQLFEQGFQKLTDNDFVCDYEGRRSECCVKPNGDVVSCAYCSELPIGNIKQSSIWNIWYSDKMREVKTVKIGDVAGCRGCKLRELCGTGCRANAYFLHGDFYNAKDDYACLAVSFFKRKVAPLLREYGFAL